MDQYHWADCLEDQPKKAEKDITSDQKRFLIKELAGKLQYLNLSRGPGIQVRMSRQHDVKDETTRITSLRNENSNNQGGEGGKHAQHQHSEA